MTSWHTWKRALLLGALAAPGWLAYRTCPCVIEEFGDDQVEGRLRIASLPDSCATFTIPASGWILPNKRGVQVHNVYASDVQYYELRQSRQAAGELLVGLRGRRDRSGPVEYAENKFAFRFHPLGRNGSARVDEVRLASEQEWAATPALGFLDTSTFVDVDPRMTQVGNRNFVIFKDQEFPRAEAYSGFSSRRMVSAGEVFIAVPSDSGPSIQGGLNFNPIPDVWWRTFVIDTFRVATRTRLSRIKGWTCIGGLGQTQYIVWQGDEFFTMPLTPDARQMLLCDLRGQ